VSRFECTDPQQDGERIALAISELLTGVGEDGDREGLTETPARAAKAWLKWTEGYGQDPQALLKSFEERDYSEMVVVKDIPLYSKCEHHLADIFGTATVAYIPNGRVLGLSKLSRLVNVFARRLQVQERMTVQVANALHVSALQPKGVGVQLRCRHMCMESRGICQQGHYTVTTALRGVIATGEPRAEFLAVAGAP
jgi:GTP cyclohydrolase I